MKSRTGLVVALLMASFGAGSLAAQVTAESDTWEGFYEADDLPHNAPSVGGQFGWQDLGGGSTIDSIIVPDGSNNYLNFDYNNGVGGGGSYEGFRYLGHTDGGHYPPNDPDENLFNPQTNGGISIEFRIRMHSGTFLMHMWTSSPADGRWLTTLVSDTNITINDSNNFSENPIDVGNTNGPGEWTTFRITCDDTTWRVYRDTDQSVQAQLPVVDDHGPYGLYQFALYGTQPGAVFDFDFVRWTNEGALSPGQAVPQCGDSGFKVSDFNEDCYVNLADFQYIADEWMECTDPANAACDQFYL
jgi:hypothetical protein